MISLINHDSSEGEQWGRYNLPRIHSQTDQWSPCLMISLWSFQPPGRHLLLRNRPTQRPQPPPCQEWASVTESLDLFIYMNIYIYICIYIYIFYLHIFISISISISLSIYLSIYISTFLSIYLSIYIYIYVCIYTHLHPYIYLYTSVSI